MDINVGMPEKKQEKDEMSDTATSLSLVFCIKYNGKQLISTLKSKA
jgi:hypothetical protein